MQMKQALGAAALFTVLCLGFAYQALAMDYYVNTSGSDAWSGSADNPWQTLQHAVDAAQPGDNIYVNSGTYAGFRAQNSGSADAWITLQAVDGAEVIIDRPGSGNRHNSNLEFETWEGDGIVHHWRVSGLQVKDAPKYGIDIRGSADSVSHHFEIEGNTVWNSGVTGIFTAFVDDASILNNHSYNNGEHGVYLSNSGDRPLVEGNWLYGNRACGVQLNADVTMGGDGLISDAVITGNRIYENGSAGGAAINLDGVIGSQISFNTIYDNYAGGLALYMIDGAQPSSNSSITNNIIYMPSGARWAVNLTDYGVSDVSLMYNTIYHAGPKGSVRLPTTDLSGFSSDYNDITGVFSVDGGDSSIGWDAWRSYGYDLHSEEAPSQMPDSPGQTPEPDDSDDSTFVRLIKMAL